MKGFKIDRQKVAELVEAPRGDPIVDAGIRVVVEQLNRSVYIDIVAGYEPPGPDEERHLALIIALEFDEEEKRLKKKKLRDIDESIKAALPHTLVGPDVGNFLLYDSLAACL